MKELTLELLPSAVGYLIEKVSSLEHLISTNNRAGYEVEKPLSIKDAAAFLNLEVPTLYSLVQKRAVPFHKRGKRLYFFTDELVEWIKAGGTSSGGKVQQQTEEVFLAANKSKGGGRWGSM